MSVPAIIVGFVVGARPASTGVCNSTAGKDKIQKMFTTLLLKEIHESITNYRFLIALVLCVLLIPLGTFVSVRDYEQRLANYNQAMQLYHERSQGNVRSGFSAKGFRPPSELSFLATGLEERLPSVVNTYRTGNYWYDYENEMTNPLALLFGKLDLLFIVGFVLSILALIFTFNSISGEKERGTLRLQVANPVPRALVYTAKVTGNFTVFAVPFMLALLVSMLIVNLSSSLNMFSAEVFAPFAVFVLLSLLFILAMLCLGMLISSLTHSSMTSMVALLLVWIVLVLVVPKASPMLAQAIFPVQSAQVVNQEKQAVRSDMNKELDNQRAELLDRVAVRYKMIDGDNLTGGDFLLRRNTELLSEQVREQALAEYDSESEILEEKYEGMISAALKKIEDAYEGKRQKQTTLAAYLSRVSPVSCFTYLVSELAGTSLLELKNFQENAGRYQQYVEETVYDHYDYKRYVSKGGNIYSMSSISEGFDQEKAPVPHMTNYHRMGLAEVLNAQWLDLLLLALYAVAFFAAGFVAFNRYDVR